MYLCGMTCKCVSDYYNSQPNEQIELCKKCNLPEASGALIGICFVTHTSKICYRCYDMSNKQKKLFEELTNELIKKAESYQLRYLITESGIGNMLNSHIANLIETY
jgi:hypothetical protein